MAAVSSAYKASATSLEVVLYEKVGMGTGVLANNPWLQEFPDPITKLCWDNYACISQKTAKELGVAQDDVVKIEVKGKSVELPVLIQPIKPMVLWPLLLVTGAKKRVKQRME
ncbi:MAG: hypothetical protein R2822_06295 [Spirosomataceae bacterium]